MNKGMLSFDEALARLLADARPVAQVEEVETLAALGRVLAVGVYSQVDVPPADNSAMDGYAVRAADLDAAGVRLPVSQRIPAGSVGHTLAPGTAARIFTGGQLPAGADAIVMQELCAHEGDHVVINHVPAPGEWVSWRGEDIAAGSEILPAGTRMRPQEMGVAASAGLRTVVVKRQVRVALFCTGDELTQPGEPLPPGGIYNSNRYTLRGLLEQMGCVVEDFGNVPDRLDATRDALRRAAAGNDLIVTSGGVSMGEEDHVRPAVMAEGRLDLWKIAIKPGKPLAFGHVGDAAFIGLPGNPVSSFVTFLMLVRPFVQILQGGAAVTPRRLRVQAAFEWPRPDVRREFLRARLLDDGRVALYPNQRAGVLTSAVWADGLVDNPPGQAVGVGDMVSFVPFSELLG